jgi:hypothetical protein
MEKSNCTIPVRNKMLRGVKAERNILQSIKRRNWIGHNLRRNYLLKRVIERKIEGMGSGSVGRRGKQLLNDLEVKSGYWQLKEEALYPPLQKTRFGSGYGPVARKTT